MRGEVAQQNPENHETAYNVLMKRYEKTIILLRKLLDSILWLPHLTNEGWNVQWFGESTRYIFRYSNLELEHNDRRLEWSNDTHLPVKKLDKRTRKHYEFQLVNPREPQKIDEFFTYIVACSRALESHGRRNVQENMHHIRKAARKTWITLKNMPEKERFKAVKRKKWSIKCLRVKCYDYSRRTVVRKLNAKPTMRDITKCYTIGIPTLL